MSLDTDELDFDKLSSSSSWNNRIEEFTGGFNFATMSRNVHSLKIMVNSLMKEYVSNK